MNTPNSSNHAVPHYSNFVNLSNQDHHISGLNTEREFFLVQRCWHSGVNIHQPIDYLRLFASRAEAEEAAYHSAHVYARKFSPQDPQVKTLLLPSISMPEPELPMNVASYGFVTCGSLYWIRSVFVGVSPDFTNDASAKFYAAVTNGVIGGTGNQMSRRGTEASRGRVFCGSFQAQNMAQQCTNLLNSTMSQANTYVTELAFGKPDAGYQTGRFLQEWPAQVDIQSGGPSMDAENDATVASSHANKRQFLQELKQHHHDHANANSSIDNSTISTGIHEHDGFYLPAAKRRRTITPPTTFFGGQDPSQDHTMMM